MKALRYLYAMLGTSVVAGLILAVLAPYGTYQMSVAGRLIFWVGLCVAGGLGAGTFEFLMQKTGRRMLPWQRVLCQSLGATLAVWMCFLVLHGVTGRTLGAHVYTILPVYIWIISILISGVGELMNQRKSESEGESVTPRAPLFERLKPALRESEIYALSAEDHYVRVHTSNGDDLVLMRLSDAIKETVPLLGLQTHRSWWIGEKGVKQVRKSEGKTIIVLHNEIEAPVSRNNRKRVKEAGWG